MAMYHATTEALAGIIDLEGFKDGRPSLIDGSIRQGVYISDKPLRELPEAPVVVFAIEISQESVAEFECTHEEQGFRQWLVPATILNAASRSRVND